MSMLNKYRSILRKKMARLKLAKNVNNKKIAQIKKDLAEETPDETKIVLALGLDLTLGKLIDTLEALLAEEQASNKNQVPSQTDIERWALKAATLDFYRGLGLPRTTIVIENPTQPKTIHQFAPDKNAIYNTWLQKLADLTKKSDANQYQLPKFDENVERSIPRGGAFEKQLQRYREEFVSEMIGRQIK